MPYKSYKGSKATVVFLSFLSFVIAYIIRTNLSVAIVAMVKSNKHSKECYPINHSKYLNYPNEDSIPGITPFLDGERQSLHNDNLTNFNNNKNYLPWSKPVQGYILASFFYGYIVTQIPGGWLSYKYGAKLVLGIGVFVASLFTLVSPLAAVWSPYAFMIARIGQGLGEGVMLPATHNLISKWAPPLQRTKITSLIYSGIPLGTILSMPLSGYLAKYGFGGGWPSVFYVSGVLGCLWCIAWMFCVYESPFANPHIEASELAYLKSEYFPHEAQNTSNRHSFKDIPLTAILKSLPFWAIVFSNISHTWGLYTLITEVPTYFKEALNMDNISKNGLYSALPFLAMWVCLVSGGQISDFYRKRGVKTIRMRKICNSLGLFVPTIILIVIGYVIKDVCSIYNQDGTSEAILKANRESLIRKNTVIGVSAITLIAGFLGFGNSGYMVNPLDLSPPLAGVLLSITNTFGTLSGIISPSVTSAFTSKNSGPNQWRKVFFSASCVLVTGALFFLFAASGEEQPWSPSKNVYALSPSVNDVEEGNESKAQDVERNQLKPTEAKSTDEI